MCHDSSIQTADAITIDQTNNHHKRKQNEWQLVVTIASRYDFYHRKDKLKNIPNGEL